MNSLSELHIENKSLKRLKRSVDWKQSLEWWQMSANMRKWFQNDVWWRVKLLGVTLRTFGEVKRFDWDHKASLNSTQFKREVQEWVKKFVRRAKFEKYVSEVQ